MTCLHVLSSLSFLSISVLESNHSSCFPWLCLSPISSFLLSCKNQSLSSSTHFLRHLLHLLISLHRPNFISRFFFLSLFISLYDAFLGFFLRKWRISEEMEEGREEEEKRKPLSVCSASSLSSPVLFSYFLASQPLTSMILCNLIYSLIRYRLLLLMPESLTSSVHCIRQHKHVLNSSGDGKCIDAYVKISLSGEYLWLHLWYKDDAPQATTSSRVSLEQKQRKSSLFFSLWKHPFRQVIQFGSLLLRSFVSDVESTSWRGYLVNGAESDVASGYSFLSLSAYYQFFEQSRQDTRGESTVNVNSLTWFSRQNQDRTCLCSLHLWFTWRFFFSPPFPCFCICNKSDRVFDFPSRDSRSWEGDERKKWQQPKRKIVIPVEASKSMSEVSSTCNKDSSHGIFFFLSSSLWTLLFITWFWM